MHISRASLEHIVYTLRSFATAQSHAIADDISNVIGPNSHNFELSAVKTEPPQSERPNGVGRARNGEVDWSKEKGYTVEQSGGTVAVTREMPLESESIDEKVAHINEQLAIADALLAAKAPSISVPREQLHSISLQFDIGANLYGIYRKQVRNGRWLLSCILKLAERAYDESQPKPKVKACCNPGCGKAALPGLDHCEDYPRCQIAH